MVCSSVQYSARARQRWAALRERERARLTQVHAQTLQALQSMIAARRALNAPLSRAQESAAFSALHSAMERDRQTRAQWERERQSEVDTLPLQLIAVACSNEHLILRWVLHCAVCKSHANSFR